MTTEIDDATLDRMIGRIRARETVAAVIGLGYVGLPLAIALVEAGYTVIGVDTDPEKPRHLAEGRSYLRHIPDAAIAGMVESGRFRATVEAAAAEAEVVVLCVPTPLTRQREPDLSFVKGTAEAIAPHLRPGVLVVLESTTYPGTTEEVLIPALETGPRRAGRDLFVAFAPEREDPGVADHTTSRIPKVIGGHDDASRRLAMAFYEPVVPGLVPVANARTAEAVKLTENIFRAVNIALVNELKVVFDAMGIDVWEVIEAAKTKPFGYMPFYPGPGLGGHCIPIDPFYLTWKAREFDLATRFIELAGEVNTAMPGRVVEVLARALDQRQGRGLRDARIVLLGVGYKKNVGDTRESPALKIADLLIGRGARVIFVDPHLERLPALRHFPDLTGQRMTPWPEVDFEAAEAVLIVTDHDDFDYAELDRRARLIVDTRNAMARHGIDTTDVIKA
ncbi:MAG: nucleotide sugar dehydrogenase [Azospirillaceae bacterium]